MQASKISNDFLEISTLSLEATLQKLIIKKGNDTHINIVAGYNHLSFYEKNKGRLSNPMEIFTRLINKGKVSIENQNFIYLKKMVFTYTAEKKL